jgi:hypothetical protein
MNNSASTKVTYRVSPDSRIRATGRPGRSERLRPGLQRRFLHERQRLAQRIARRDVRGNHRRALPIEMVQFLGRDRFPNFDQIGQLHQLPVAAPHEDRGQVIGLFRS